MERERQVAVQGVLEAAAAIRTIWDRADAWVQDKAGGKGPLTEADLAADRILQERLAAAFPDDGILSEETTDDPSRLGKRRVWILDPLDGTREFVDRVPEFVVSVGLVVDGQATLGVLANPVTGELMVGVVGEGVWYNGEPAGRSDQRTLAGARILVSASENRKGGFDTWKAQGLEVEPMGSVAYKVGLVATGRADATFTPKPRNEWDLCGGVAIVRAAGGRATNGAGVDYTFNRADPLHHGVMVTNGHLHAPLMDLVRG